MKSVTQESNLDEFLTTAALAGTDFTAGELGADEVWWSSC